MKEIMKSKFMILFIVLMLGVTYINSIGLEKLNNKNIETNEIIMNK
jgi:hypothetical protein